MTTAYRIPAGPARAEIEIARSRFIASLAAADTPEAARAFVQAVRAEFSGANHHGYAFRAGFPPSVTEGMSDDGEPAGTTGPPLLAVLRGSNTGDLVLVVTRYFGGTKLGTGGLVRAYTEAAQSVLTAAEFTVKRDQLTLGLDVPYALFETARRAIVAEGGEIIDQSFAADVTLLLRIERDRVEGLQRALADLSAGSLAAVCLD
jgi:uncharacterized YigZ family protein